jgi:quercetin 2,3-dioxygenase
MTQLISNIKPLGFTWETNNPFLFCVHHLDLYPRGNDSFGPAASLEGRNLGQDFTEKDGWRMYHGETIPGFPAHPHRGFETVTVVLKGIVDHSDSHGAAGRYGNGDVQWMTAGSGLQHCEMFPLLNKDKDNTLELFQIWLNLPRKDKFVDPHFKMLWAEDIPTYKTKDKNGKSTEAIVIAGKIDNTVAVAPAPNSMAASPENDIAIWLIKMEPGAEWALPLTSADTLRTLYFYRGSDVKVAGTDLPLYHSADVLANSRITIQNGNSAGYLLLLQGKPLKEPIVQHGPFVMNSEEEIRQAFADYRQTQFGGWPWNQYDNVHPQEMGRFARYADGREEFPG